MTPIALLVLAACAGAPAGDRAAPAAAPAAPTTASSEPAPHATSRLLVTASGVRLRPEPSTASAEVARLSIGTTLTPIDGAQPGWQRVRTDAGQEGWVSTTVTRAVNEPDLVGAKLALAEQRLRADDAGFADRVDLVHMLDAFTGPPEVPLLRLLAIRRALDARAVSGQQDPGIAPWAATLGDLVFHDEVSDSWLLRRDAVWALFEPHRGTALGDRVAWEATQTALGGECEGDPTCMMMSVDLGEGRYLRAAPSGAHVSEALATITSIATGEYLVDAAKALPRDQRKDLRGALDALQAAVSATPASPARDRALAALTALR